MAGFDPRTEQLVEMYGRMCLIRAMEEHARDLYVDGTIRGATHMYIGEEAVAVGACTALRRDDYITSTQWGSRPVRRTRVTTAGPARCRT